MTDNTIAEDVVERAWTKLLRCQGLPSTTTQDVVITKSQLGEFMRDAGELAVIAAAFPPKPICSQSPTVAVAGDVERVARALFKDVYGYDMGDDEGWLNRFKEHARAAIAALQSSPNVIEALEAADRRLCELTPNFPPDVGPDARDAAEVEETGLVVLQIRDALAKLKDSHSPSGEPTPAMIEAREAFLNMLADARDFHDEPDGDETGDHTHFIINTHWRQLSELCMALGIKEPGYMETWADAIDKAIAAPAMQSAALSPSHSNEQEAGK